MVVVVMMRIVTKLAKEFVKGTLYNVKCLVPH